MMKMISIATLFAFVITTLLPVQWVQAQAMVQAGVNLPVPGTMVTVTGDYEPARVKGVMIHPDHPLAIDFIVDTGDTGITGQDLVDESNQLIKYFLASMTIPEEEMWVNLSPYENDRIIAKDFGQTEMGRDLLAQDYMLKQLTSSLMYPEDDLGEKFWERVYTRAMELYGSTDIPLSTYNKVWIVPNDAKIFESDGKAYIVKRTMSVMLEKDYVAMSKAQDLKQYGLDSREDDPEEEFTEAQAEIIREVLIPEIEREVNYGKTFAKLRQIFDAMILATWYKIRLKESLLGRIYVDKNKVAGVSHDNPQVNEDIWRQYVASFHKGVYDLIREEYDPATQSIVPRKYFSGGVLTRRGDGKNLKEVVNAMLTRDGRDADVSRDMASLVGPVYQIGTQVVEANPAMLRAVNAFVPKVSVGQKDNTTMSAAATAQTLSNIKIIYSLFEDNPYEGQFAIDFWKGLVEYHLEMSTNLMLSFWALTYQNATQAYRMMAGFHKFSPEDVEKQINPNLANVPKLIRDVDTRYNNKFDVKLLQVINLLGDHSEGAEIMGMLRYVDPEIGREVLEDLKENLNNYLFWYLKLRMTPIVTPPAEVPKKEIDEIADVQELMGDFDNLEAPVEVIDLSTNQRRSVASLEEIEELLNEGYVLYGTERNPDYFPEGYFLIKPEDLKRLTDEQNQLKAVNAAMMTPRQIMKVVLLVLMTGLASPVIAQAQQQLPEEDLRLGPYHYQMTIQGVRYDISLDNSGLLIFFKRGDISYAVYGYLNQYFLSVIRKEYGVIGGRNYGWKGSEVPLPTGITLREIENIIRQAEEEYQNWQGFLLMDLTGAGLVVNTSLPLNVTSSMVGTLAMALQSMAGDTLPYRARPIAPGNGIQFQFPWKNIRIHVKDLGGSYEIKLFDPGARTIGVPKGQEDQIQDENLRQHGLTPKELIDMYEREKGNQSKGQDSGPISFVPRVIPATGFQGQVSSKGGQIKQPPGRFVHRKGRRENFAMLTPKEFMTIVLMSVMMGLVSPVIAQAQQQLPEEDLRLGPYYYQMTIQGVRYDISLDQSGLLIFFQQGDFSYAVYGYLDRYYLSIVQKKDGKVYRVIGGKASGWKNPKVPLPTRITLGEIENIIRQAEKEYQNWLGFLLRDLTGARFAVNTSLPLNVTSSLVGSVIMALQSMAGDTLPYRARRVTPATAFQGQVSSKGGQIKQPPGRFVHRKGRRENFAMLTPKEFMTIVLMSVMMGLVSPVIAQAQQNSGEQELKEQPAISHGDADNVGGINLNADLLNLEIERDSRGIPLPMDQQDLQRLQNVEGFLPLIIDVRPIVNLPFLLGMGQTQDEGPKTADRGIDPAIKEI